MGLISTNNGDYNFKTVDEALETVRDLLPDKNDIYRNK